MKTLLLKIWIKILAAMRTPLHPRRRKRSELKQRALTRAIFVFGFGMTLGRVAAPLVVAWIFGAVERLDDIRVFVTCCLSAGTLTCGLMAWIEYRWTVYRGLKTIKSSGKTDRQRF